MFLSFFPSHPTGYRIDREEERERGGVGRRDITLTFEESADTCTANRSVFNVRGFPMPGRLVPVSSLDTALSSLMFRYRNGSI